MLQLFVEVRAVESFSCVCPYSHELHFLVERKIENNAWEKGFDRVGDTRKGPPQSYGSPLRVAFLALVLHAGGRDSLDEVLLGGEEDHYRGQDRDDRHGHDPVPVEIGGNVHRHP